MHLIQRERARLNPEEASLLSAVTNNDPKYRYSTLLYIAGDFNAKDGRKNDESEDFWVASHKS